MKQALSAALLALYAVVSATMMVLTAAARAAPDPPRATDPWHPVRGLLGAWEGDVKGEPGRARVSASTT